jgi:predicted ATPase
MAVPESLAAGLADGYRLESELGAGGMAVVYLAHDLRHNRKVALKVLRPEFAASLGRGRFLREIETAANLRHPNILPLFDSGDADGALFYVMPLVEGESLRDRLTRETRLPVDEALGIADEVADALAYAHSRGVVHRDVKPENILLENGHAAVADFGIARAASLGGDVQLTATGVLLGTPTYMSPEQWSGEPIDGRTDLYALGCMLFEMLAGRPPHTGPTAASIMAHHLVDPPPDLGTLRPETPPHLVAAIERALAKAPVDRFATVAEFRVALADSSLSGAVSSPAALTISPTVREERRPGNLPSSVDSFVAREQELAELIATLAEARLVTLTGAGGTGKTRLALEAARRSAAELPGGAWLVELAPVTHGEAVLRVVADLIGAIPRPGQTVLGSVVDALRPRSLLLVLDNCEHVLDAAAELAAAVTTQCDSVRILATSREVLAVRGEHVTRLLSLTDTDGARLFRDRARAAGAPGDLDESTLTRLSRQLDGMPLAIELAAARCASMSPEEIERRLDDRFRLLRGSRRGSEKRHQTLRDTVAWSYDLLEEPERRVFDRLSMFAGGFTMDAAQTVAGGDEEDATVVEDAIAALVTRSMVLASTTEDGTRYRLLETLRQFGEERLAESGHTDSVRQLHIRYYADFMARAWSGLWGAHDLPWIRAVGHEFENLRAAVYRAIEAGDREALAALLEPQMWWAWHSLRYEVGDWAEAALAVSPEPAFARPVATHLHFHGGRHADAVRLAAGLADLEDDADPEIACLTSWGRWDAALATGSGDVTTWMQRTIEAGRRSGNAARAAALESIEVAMRLMGGETDLARRIAVEAHQKARATGNETALCWTSFFMGRAHTDSDPQLALQHFDHAIEIATRCGIPLVGGIASTEAAVVIARVEEPGRARTRLARAVRSFLDSGDRGQLWTSAHHLAFFLIRLGRAEDARLLWKELGSRQGYAAQHHREELTTLLGSPGERALSDGELVELIRRLLHELESRVDP